MAWEIQDYKDFAEWEKKIIDKAQKDFDEMVKNSSEKEIKEFCTESTPWLCMRFARQHVPRHTENIKLYQYIYRIASNYADNYKDNK